MSDTAVRELAGRAGIAVEWRDYANEQQRVSAGQSPPHSRSTAASLRHGRRLGGEPPPIADAAAAASDHGNDRAAFRSAGCRKSPGSGAAHLRGRHDCGPYGAQRATRRAAARHRDAGLSHHRVRSRAHHGRRSRRRIATRLRTSHQRSARGDSRCKSTACAAPAIAASATPPASSRLPARLPAFGQTPSRSARCMRCLLPIQTISVRIRRRAGSSTIPFTPTREHCSVRHA